ncbi:hypothetical protein WJX79_009275 [Trebouxia sp. C0005]
MPTRLGVLKGHTQAVLCCEALFAQSLLASGDENGAVCMHDLRSHALTARVQVSAEEAVPSLLLDRKQEYRVLACAGNDIIELDLRKGDANCCVRQHSCTAAEINQLAAAPEGNLLAAADDDGCVTIIDSGNEQFHCQKLNGNHDNICSSAVFRRHKPNEVISGGLDCKLIHWDTTTRGVVSTRQAGAESTTEPKVTNPPMIHSLAVSSSCECPAAQLVAAACGNGTIAVWDLDKGRSTANKQTRARQRRPEYVLGDDQIGHRAAATCVKFVGADTQRLLSGGNDCQLCLWQHANMCVRRDCSRWLNNPHAADMIKERLLEKAQIPATVAALIVGHTMHRCC